MLTITWWQLAGAWEQYQRTLDRRYTDVFMVRGGAGGAGGAGDAAGQPASW